MAGEFLRYVVETDLFIATAEISHGTHMPRADWAIIRNLNIRVPPIAEQMAIAEMLSDMDAEIAGMEQQLAKTCASKQGMMQALLTGRVRLAQPAAVAG